MNSVPTGSPMLASLMLGWAPHKHSLQQDDGLTWKVDEHALGLRPLEPLARGAEQLQLGLVVHAVAVRRAVGHALPFDFDHALICEHELDLDLALQLEHAATR